jgi:hypothetical protein
MTSPIKSKWLTIRGFLKNDVYTELSRAMEAMDMHAICYAMVELVCSPREVRNYTTFMLEVFCRNYLSSNSWVMSRVLSLIQDIEAMARKKHHQHEKSFQQGVCELTLLICNERRRDISMASATKGIPTYGIDMLLLHPREDQSCGQRYCMQLSSSVCNKFTALKHALDGKDLPTALLVLQSLVTNTPPHDVQPAPFDFAHPLRDALRKDIVWYVWDFFIGEARETKNAQLHEYVRTALMLFLHAYAKKHRAARLNLLVFVSSVMTHKHVKNSAVASAIAKAASKKIHIVFDEVTGRDRPKTEYLSCIIHRQ